MLEELTLRREVGGVDCLCVFMMMRVPCVVIGVWIVGMVTMFLSVVLCVA